MTIQANQGFGVSVFGAVSGGGGGSTSPGGSSGQVQYNNGGSFGGMSGTTWTDASQSLAIASTGAGTGVTTSSPVLNLTQTWNAGAVTFTGLKFNATDTASASGSLLLDLQVGGTSKVSVSKNAQITAANTGGVTLRLDNVTANYWDIFSNSFLRFSRGTTGYFYIDANGNVTISDAKFFAFGSADTGAGQTFLRGPAAATLQLGAADAAAPVAQTFKVQGVVAGTTNTAGANFTIQGSQGTGTGAGGSIIFQVAPAGSSGTAQNAYVTALSILNPASNNVMLRLLSNNAYIKSTDANTFAIGDFNSGSSSINYGILVRPLSNDTGLKTSIGITIAGGAFGSNETFIYSDAANTLALRNGGTAASPVPQTFNIYNTYTDASNYERVSAYWSGNTFLLSGQKSGTGAARNIFIGTETTGELHLMTAGSSRWYVVSGNFYAGVDNTYDIGASGTTNRVRTFYSGGGYSAAAPTIKTANYSQGIHDYSLIFNGTGSITLTLLAAATYPGKILYVKTIAAQTVVSASSNVKPIDTDTAGTAILAATAGKWAMLQSDGTDWVIMAQG